MQDMGIDEGDISEVPTTASKKLKAKKEDSVAAMPGNSTQDGPNNTPSTPGALNDKVRKEKGRPYVYTHLLSIDCSLTSSFSQLIITCPLALFQRIWHLFVQ